MLCMVPYLHVRLDKSIQVHIGLDKYIEAYIYISLDRYR